MIIRQIAALALFLAAPAPAQVCGLLDTGGSWGTGSSGADGALLLDGSPPGAGITLDGSVYTIDLSDPVVANNYCPDRWAMVFQYSSITVGSGFTVRFLNHSSRAPVVWLSTGPIDVAGSVQLNGAGGQPWNGFPSYAEPGPGGFRGGKRGNENDNRPSAGFGPGGGLWSSADVAAQGSSASHLTAGNPYTNSFGNVTRSPGPLYGDPGLRSLIGGSGGGAGYRVDNFRAGGGGAGGGAILLASDASVTVTGSITCDGGNTGVGWGLSSGGCGSGGAIRIVSPLVALDGACLSAAGGYQSGSHFGGSGVIRIEHEGTAPGNWACLNSGDSGPNIERVLSPLFPDLRPEVQVAAWRPEGSSTWLPVDQDPRSRFYPFQDIDLNLGEPGSYEFRIDTFNVPVATDISVRWTSANGGVAFFPTLSGESGNFTYGSSTILVSTGQGVATIQATVKGDL